MFAIEEEFAGEILEKKKLTILTVIREIRKLSAQLEKISKSKKYAIARGRLIINISHLIRELKIRSAYKENMTERLSEELKVIDESETSQKGTLPDLGVIKGKTVHSPWFESDFPL